jgi:hypothetical protein
MTDDVNFLSSFMYMGNPVISVWIYAPFTSILATKYCPIYATMAKHVKIACMLAVGDDLFGYRSFFYCAPFATSRALILSNSPFARNFSTRNTKQRNISASLGISGFITGFTAFNSLNICNISFCIASNLAHSLISFKSSVVSFILFKSTYCCGGGTPIAIRALLRTGTIASCVLLGTTFSSLAG